jgi:glycosyltransferase involved in cell wall biosynthesis
MVGTGLPCVNERECIKGRRGKRIAILLPDLRAGGAERVNLHLAREEYLTRGYDVDFVMMSASGPLMDEVPEGALVFDLGVMRLRNALWPLVSYLRRERPDALQVSMWPLTCVAVVARALARARCRVVVSDHNTLSVAYAGRGGLHRTALKTTLALTYPHAEARVAVSSGVADDLAALSGMSRSRFEVIHNPIPLPVGADRSTATPHRAPDGSGRRILSVGTLKAQKNHALLIRAFARMVRQADDHLTIVGEGTLRPDLEALARSEGVEDCVSFPGFTADPGQYYVRSDLFVLSSDYEGFGNVIVEALAHGLPVVSTDCPSGPSEILEDGRYGRLVPVGDAPALASAMEEALSSDHDREALRRRAADFVPSKAADAYLRLLFPETEQMRPDPEGHIGH